MKSKFIILFSLLITFSAFQWVDNLFIIPPHFPKPVYDFSKNSLTESKIQLGRALFYDPILSRNNTISCASCHSQFSAFTHIDHELSHGIDNKIGTRNSSSLMNLAWKDSFMWDGAVHHLDVQSLAPITNPLEMDEKFENVIIKLRQSTLYTKLFYQAYGDSIITGEKTLKAISQFMLTLVSANSRYDSVMLGLSTFDLKQKNGYELFKRNCASCHKEPLFTNNELRNNGLPLDTTLNDLGRFKVTQNPADSLKFKVPTLRNIEVSYPYMHDGRFKTIKQVLNHYTTDIKRDKYISSELLNPIVLSSNEKVEITAFLLTLTDRQFLANPKHSYPRKIFSEEAKD